jgi:energy-coupling factor transporter ATP-binding protein EcfA2
LHEILKWSADRPDWQRDALRRIVTKDALEAGDLVELDRLCRAKHGADKSAEPATASSPLAATHLPPSPGAAASVTLISIGSLQHVNRLPSDQVLSFGGSPGLTVVYGENGSGKSGYARVIKKACRTRGTPPPIKPNAFAPHPKDAATADITCHLAGKSQSVTWKDGTVSEPSLANVFVFDASTAGHYLHEDGPAAFTPHGLDVLRKLSETCDALSARMQADISNLNTAIESLQKNWRYPPATKVATLIESLSHKTKPADVDALASFVEADSKRLAELDEALQSDPKQKAKETRASAARVRAFATTIAATASELGAPKVEALRQLFEDARNAIAAAQVFASGQFDASYLTGTGGATWRTLFEAARAFSVNDAYRDQDFPALSSSTKCVLCQQTLDEDAAERFRAFDAFCKNQSQQVAAEAALRLETAAARIGTLQMLQPEYAKVEADLAGATSEQKASLNAFIKSADETLDKVKENLAKRHWVKPVGPPATPHATLIELATALETRAVMEESADNPEERRKLTAERNELAAQQWLVGVKADVLAQIERYKDIALLEKCQKDTATRGITEKNTELTTTIVTEAFCKRFQVEVTSLGLRTISVKLDDIKGKKAETRFGLRLIGAEGHKIHEVASEGEQRCIALAAFLAELSQASHQSALVFDDPVSSLDHWNRETIADRLVKESLSRQVIVLTHDAVFLNDLQSHAETKGANATYRFLEWAGNTPGQCQDGLPWDCKSPEDRLDKLDKKQKEIAATWSPQPNESNKAAMRDAYSWLRATIERIVERVVFADVVFRFRSYVKLKDLKDVVGFTQAECDDILRLHQQCCHVTDAHDPASGKQAPVPEPAQLGKDISAAKAVLAAVRLRRKTKTASKPVAKSAANPRP